MGYKLRAGGRVSYTRLHELFLEKLTEVGLDTKLFGLHSLGSGGGSTAAIMTPQTDGLRDMENAIAL